TFRWTIISQSPEQIQQQQQQQQQQQLPPYPSTGDNVMMPQAYDSRNINQQPSGDTPESNTAQPITILQALDSNNQPIINDGTTTSNSIVLHMQPNENVPIQNVQCFIDNSPIVPCSNNPVVIDNLPQGNHVFQLQVTDGLGLSEPSTSTFRWTIISQSPEQIQQQQQQQQQQIPPYLQPIQPMPPYT
ncbi:MAG: hypothetical protein WAM26_16590, partial [Nitrososphaeraceae archaeon]